LTEWEGAAAASPDDGNTDASSSSSSSEGDVGMGVNGAGGDESMGSDERIRSERLYAHDPVILCQGEELYISYMSNCDAAAAYLSFGFVPPELKQASGDTSRCALLGTTASVHDVQPGWSAAKQRTVHTSPGLHPVTH
jgi:hypothetical protein